MTHDLIPGFITVRTSSSRLPQKCLLPFGNCNVITHVIRRAKYYNIDPILCTSIDSSDDILIDIAIKEGIKYFRGSLNNKLKRWYDCSNEYNLSFFHTIDADDPFFDGDQMHRSINLLKKEKFDIVCPTDFSSSGGASVGYSLSSEVVREAVINLEDNTDTEMIWNYLKNIQNVKSTVLEELTLNPPKMRLTLDYNEDYWLLNIIQRLVGTYGSREEINLIFERNPDLSSINWFLNKEWKDAQIKKSK